MKQQTSPTFVACMPKTQGYPYFNKGLTQLVPGSKGLFINGSDKSLQSKDLLSLFPPASKATQKAEPSLGSLQNSTRLPFILASTLKLYFKKKRQKTSKPSCPPG